MRKALTSIAAAAAAAFAGGALSAPAPTDAKAKAGKLFSDTWIADRSEKLALLARGADGRRFAAVRSKTDGKSLALYYAFPLTSDASCSASEAELKHMADVAGAIIPYYTKSNWVSSVLYPQPEVVVLVHGDTAHRTDAAKAECDAKIAEQLAAVPAWMQTAMFIGQPIDLYTWKQFVPPLRVEIQYGIAFGPNQLVRTQSWQANPGVAKPRGHKVLAGAVDGLAPIGDKPAAAANRRVEVWIGRDADELASVVRRSSAVNGDYSGIETECDAPNALGFCAKLAVEKGRLDALPIASLIFMPQVDVRSDVGGFVMGHGYARPD